MSGEIGSSTSKAQSIIADGGEWLFSRMTEVGISSISELALKTGINKGTLSKYFRGLQRPSIDVLPVLCRELKVSPATLLEALGVTLPVD